MIYRNENLKNIRERFSSETGVEFEEKKAATMSTTRIISSVLAVCLIAALLLVPINQYGNSIVLTVNAADGVAVEIGTTPVVVEYDFPFAEAAYGDISGMTTGTEVLEYSVNVQGKNIERIHYSIADTENAWFQEQYEMSEAEFQLQKSAFETTSVYRGISGEPGIWTVTSYIGAEYEVPYDEQDTHDVYLEYQVEKYDGNWAAADITIDVEIYTDDGTVLQKTILIQPQVVGLDSEGMSSVKISVLDP